MLKQRLITAAVLIPLVVLSLLFLSTAILQWLLAGVTVLAAWEWFALMGFNRRNTLLAPFGLLVIVSIIMSFFSSQSLAIIASVVWITISFFVDWFANKPLSIPSRQFFTNPKTAFILPAIVLALFWSSAVLLHGSSTIGPQQLLYIMVLVWLADTGGYFAGKRWGKTALAREISPNKTWEGVVGAVVLGFIWALIAFYLDIAGSISLSIWLLLSAISILISVVGDLFESLFKRCYDVKDSGNLLPGHGGMLDRIDSLIAAVPVFTAGIYFLGT